MFIKLETVLFWRVFIESNVLTGDSVFNGESANKETVQCVLIGDSLYIEECIFRTVWLIGTVRLLETVSFFEIAYWTIYLSDSV